MGERPRRQTLAIAAVAALLVVGVACRSAGPRPVRPGWSDRGLASWYGDPFHGRLTASGEVYDMYGLTAAHRTLPFGTVLRVRNLDNGREVTVVVTDRGPFVRGRILDLSYGAARSLGMDVAGIARVEIEALPARSIPVARAAAASRGAWSIQVGAFADRDRALALMLGLRARFPDVRVEESGPWHRVRIGPYESRRAAERARRALVREGLPAVLVEG